MRFGRRRIEEEVEEEGGGGGGGGGDGEAACAAAALHCEQASGSGNIGRLLLLFIRFFKIKATKAG